MMEKELTHEEMQADFEFVDNTVLINGAMVAYYDILPYSDGTVYFYNFHVFPKNRGLGNRIFPQLLNHLAENYKKIRLQVSGSNPAALHLYKKYGLKITEKVCL